MKMQAEALQVKPVRPMRGTQRQTTIFMLAFFVFLLSSLSDLASRVTLGPITLSALATVLIALFSWFLVLVVWRRVARRALSLVAPLLIFCLWGLLSLGRSGFNVPGVQNLVMYLLFIGLVLAASQVVIAPRYLAWLERTMRFFAFVCAIAYGAGLITQGPGARLIISPRQFSIFMLLPIAYYVARWRSGKRSALYWALAYTALVVLSLSRTASAVAVFLFPLAYFQHNRPRRWIVFLIVGAAAALGLYLAFTYYPPLQERFMTGDVSLQVGNVVINASGRTRAWQVTTDSWLESPWLGKGAGSAAHVLAESGIWLEHPHNEYLRFLHDYGIVGLCLWLWGYGALMIACYRLWFNTKKRHQGVPWVHQWAFLSLVGMALMAITDNNFVYLFCMGPLGLITGTSLAAARTLSPASAVKQSPISTKSSFRSGVP